MEPAIHRRFSARFESGKTPQLQVTYEPKSPKSKPAGERIGEFSPEYRKRRGLAVGWYDLIGTGLRRALNGQDLGNKY